ncbi:uncharacterized protein FTOL_11649 [Fusarium torulosum]|uniref:Uncharacterized protein n=1 Tax=Fusarium torulosum TaxID=33205 RepID=A0AAE8MJ59_9HYPO|nr:uncharacterized protein FTOL_11649 [Fusarium torulosum]
MKGAVLSVLATGAVAQITRGPFAGLDLGLGQGHADFRVAAIDRNDPEFATCQQAIGIVQKCVSSIGGTEAAATADPEALVACACCDGRDNAAPLYSACSGYLEQEAAENTSQYEAYGTLYSACKLAPKCTGGSGSASASASGGIISRPTASPSEEESNTDMPSMTPTITSNTSPAEQTYASACVDMLDIFSSCTKNNRDFTRLPFTEQAECYCCRGSGDRLTWTDSFDKYASTCADWARTGEPDTAYPVAKTFATFCERFTDVCSNVAARTQESDSTATEEASTTEDTNSRPTGSSNGDSGNNDASTSEQNAGPVTVTVSGPAQASETGNDASSARVAFGAVLAAVAALAIAL